MFSPYVAPISRNSGSPPNVPRRRELNDDRRAEQQRADADANRDQPEESCDEGRAPPPDAPYPAN